MRGSSSPFRHRQSLHVPSNPSRSYYQQQYSTEEQAVPAAWAQTRIQHWCLLLWEADSDKDRSLKAQNKCFCTTRAKTETIFVCKRSWGERTGPMDQPLELFFCLFLLRSVGSCSHTQSYTRFRTFFRAATRYQISPTWMPRFLDLPRWFIHGNSVLQLHSHTEACFTLNAPCGSSLNTSMGRCVASDHTTPTDDSQKDGTHSAPTVKEA